MHLQMLLNDICRLIQSNDIGSVMIRDDQTFSEVFVNRRAGLLLLLSLRMPERNQLASEV
jgi:hypothetical protein